MTSLLPQYGIGIDCSDDTLTAVVMKRHWWRCHLVDRLVIPHVSTISPSECKHRYAEFVQGHGLKAPWTIVSLPRRHVVYRDLMLPAQVRDDLHSAISFQVDTLHPYADREIVWDCCLLDSLDGYPLGKSKERKNTGTRLAAAVAIGVEEVINELAQWYEERGIPVSQFVASPLLLIARGLMSVERDISVATIIVNGNESEVEVCGLGIGEDDCVRSTVIGIKADWSEPERLATIVAGVENVGSSLRPKDGSTVQVLLGQTGYDKTRLRNALVDALFAKCQCIDLEESLIATSAARLAVASKDSRGLNLMPVERRQFLQAVPMMPTYVLSGAVLLLCLGLVFVGTIQDWRYHKLLNTEISALLPRVQEIERERERSGQDYERVLYLSSIRQSARLPVDTLEEITELLPNEAWLDHVQLDGSTITLSGSARSASEVLQLLAKSSHIEAPQFLSAISRGTSGIETFRIGGRLRVSMK